MITRDTNLKGAFVIEPERFEDARGFFARVVRRRVHGDRRRGPITEANFSYNHKRGTLRGLHWQAAPHAKPSSSMYSRFGLRCGS